MNRIKTRLANNVSPQMHEEVERHITDERSCDHPRSQVQKSQEEFVVANRLLASLPIVPTNERVYELVQDIHMGLYDDISDVAESANCWDEWVTRTREILVAKGILVAGQEKGVIIIGRLVKKAEAGYKYSDTLVNEINNYIQEENAKIYDEGEEVKPDDTIRALPFSEAKNSQDMNEELLALVETDFEPDFVDSMLEKKFGSTYFIERTSYYTFSFYEK